MKPKPVLRALLLGSALLASQSLHAVTYYWDNTSPLDATGFGAAGGTWGTDAKWSASSTGTDSISISATSTSDDLFFGTNTTGNGLGTGTITVSGTVQAKSLAFGTQSGTITFSGGIINLAAAGGINLGGKTVNMGSALSGAGTSLAINGGGILNFSTGTAGFGAGGTASVSGGTVVRFSSGGTNGLGGSTGYAIDLGDATTGGTLQIANSGSVSNAINVVAGSGTRTLANNGNPTVSFTGAFTINENLAINWTGGSSSNGLTISGTNTKTIATGKTVTFTNSGTGGTLTDSAVWTGLGKITYTGSSPNTITVSGAKTHSGGSTLGAMSGTGVIAVTSSSAGAANAPTDGPFGTGTLSIAATKVRAGIAAGITIHNPITFTGDPTFTTAASEKSLIFTGNADLNGAARTLTVETGSTVAGEFVEFQGVISGANGIVKAGAGTLKLSGANTYIGLTTISAGALRITDPGSLGSTLAGVLVNGTTPATGVARLELSGGITVTGKAVTIKGGGNFVGALSSFSGINEWTGNVTVDAAGTRIGATAGASLEVSGVIDSGSNAYGLTIRTGDINSPVILSGANTYLGDTSISVGKLQLDGGDNRLPILTKLILGGGANITEFDLNGRNQEIAGLSLGASPTAVNSVNNSSGTASTLTVNAASASSFAGIIKGNLGLIKTGADTLTLAGANSYTGTTIVNAGKLVLSSAQSGTGALTVNAGATLGITASGTSQLAPASLTIANPCSLEFNNLQNVGTTLAPLLPTAAVGSVSGITVNIGSTLGAPLSGFSYPLLGNQGGTTAGYTLGTQPAGVIGHLAVSGNTLIYVVDSAPADLWTGADGTNPTWWDINTTSNWGGTATGGKYTDGDVVAFNDTAATTTVEIKAPVSPAALNFNNSSKNYTLSGSGVNVIGGGATLSKFGGGTVTLSGEHTFSGGTSLVAGQLNINSGGSSAANSAIGTGPLTISGGTIDNTSGANITLLPVIAQNWNGNFTYAGSANSLNLGTGAVTLDATRQVTVTANTLTVGGVISGAGGLTKTGNGTLALNANSLYSGPTTINAGTLSLSDGSSATGGFQNTSAVSIAAGATLAINRTGSTSQGATSALGNVPISGDGSLSMSGGAGAGILGLSLANTYTGGTSLTGGTINANNNSALGTGAVTIGSNAIRLSVSDGRTLANNITINGGAGASGRGLIENSSTGNATLAGGTITINGTPVAGGHFAAASTGTLTVANPINSTVPVIFRLGTGIFSGGGSYSDFGIYSGTVRLGANNGLSTSAKVDLGSIGTVNFDLAGFSQSLSGLTKNTNGATVGNSVSSGTSTLTTTGTSSFAGVIADNFGTGTGKVELKVNDGSLTLTGANTFSGDITIDGGILIGAGATNSPGVTVLGSRLNSRTITVNSGGTLRFDSGNILGTSHISTTAPTLVINSGGQVTNAAPASNNPINDLQINGGTLAATSGSTSGYAAWNLNGSITTTGVSTISTSDPVNGTVMLKSTGDKTSTFDVTGTLTVSAPLVENSADSNIAKLVKTGSGTMTLTAANTYTDTTTVSAGTLALVGGSQASPIIVSSGASLGFTLGSSTTSTSSVDLTNGTVKITGTVDNVSSYTLMTAAGGIIGTPALDSPIANYTLEIQESGTKLVLFHTSSGSAYATWSGGAAANLDSNNDGVRNGVAWALGAANPNVNAINLLPVSNTTSDPAYLIFSYNRSDLANADPNTTIQVQYGNNLAGWTQAIHDGNNVVIQVTEGSPTDAIVVKLKRSSLSAAGKLFARLHVTVTP